MEWLIIGSLGVIMGVLVMVPIYFGYREWRENEDRKKFVIINRAELQHRQWMSGDSHGFYGDYPPASL